MDLKNNSDFNFANISSDDIKNICNLEKELSDKCKKDIILIAYEPSAQDYTTSN